ncbi:MAG: hypothetical protein H7122_02840 [Chitinophagaceae bacterium]|nr:hypothetical protein [Chitinophagaceae bacterium]
MAANIAEGLGKRRYENDCKRHLIYARKNVATF